MDDVIAEFGKLVEDHIVRIARELGAFVVDLLDVALRAGGPDDVLGPAHPSAQPVKALLAHALGQHGDAAATEDARNRDAAAAIIPGRWPDRLVTRRVEPAGHQTGNQTAICRQHLVRADQREEAAERHEDRRTHPRQRGREYEMRRGRGKAGPGAVVVPVHAKEISRLGTIRIDRPQRAPGCFGNTRWVCELCEGWQPHPCLTQPSRRAVANNAVDDSRYNPIAHLRDRLSPGGRPQLSQSETDCRQPDKFRIGGSGRRGNCPACSKAFACSISGATSQGRSAPRCWAISAPR